MWFTFAGANEEVSVGSDSTECQVHHGSGVTGAGERSLSHRHGPPPGHEMVKTEGGNVKGRGLTVSSPVDQIGVLADYTK